MEIANTKSKFMEHINNLEKILLKELSNIENENKSFIKDETSELLKTDTGVEEDDNTMQFIADNGSESRLFTFLKKQKRKQDEIMKMLADLPPTPRVKISLEEASHEIKAIKAIGFLSVHYKIVESKRSAKRSTTKKDLDNTAQAVSVQRNQATTTSTECLRQFPWLKETLKIQLDPKDFVDRGEKYAKLNLRKVWLAVRDDNCLLIGGHVTILEEHTEENNASKYKNNYRLVKYMYDEKELTFINGCNIYCDQPEESAHKIPSMNMVLNCIPKSTQTVLLYEKSFELIDTKSMERQWCLKLDHQFEAIATNENFIYIANKGTLYKYNRNGFLIKSIKFVHCSSLALTIKGNFACHSDAFRLLSEDGSEIFSYHPVGLKTVTADNAGNIYLATEDGIQLIDQLKMETAMVFRYEKKMFDGLIGVVCNRDENLQFLHGKMSEKSEEFGQYLEERDISKYWNGYGYYKCDKCHRTSKNDHCAETSCLETRKRCVNFWEFTVHILTK